MAQHILGRREERNAKSHSGLLQRCDCRVPQNQQCPSLSVTLGKSLTLSMCLGHYHQAQPQHGKSLPLTRLGRHVSERTRAQLLAHYNRAIHAAFLFSPFHQDQFFQGLGPPRADRLCLIAKTRPPPCSGTFLPKALTSRDFFAFLPFTHSLQPQRSTVPQASASLSYEQPPLWSQHPDMGPTPETGEGDSSRQGEAAGYCVLRESSVQAERSAGQAGPGLPPPYCLTCLRQQGP